MNEDGIRIGVVAENDKRCIVLKPLRATCGFDEKASDKTEETPCEEITNYLIMLKDNGFPRRIH